MLRPFRSLILSLVLVPVALLAASGPQQAPAPPAAATTKPAPEATLAATATELKISEGLVAGLLGSYGRSAAPSDFLAWQLATGTFKEPREGDVLGPDDRNRTQTWTRVQADKDGWMQNRALSGGHLFVVVNSARARTMVLDASGYYVVRVNGEPRGGEKYGMDWVRHPVRLRAGRNVLLFQGERGRIRARLFDPPAPIFFTDSDATLPDLVPGLDSPPWAGIRLVNATEETIDRFDVAYALGDQNGTANVTMPVSALTTRKLAIPLDDSPDRTNPLRGGLSRGTQLRGRWPPLWSMPVIPDAGRPDVALSAPGVCYSAHVTLRPATRPDPIPTDAGSSAVRGPLPHPHSPSGRSFQSP